MVTTPDYKLGYVGNWEFLIFFRFPVTSYQPKKTCQQV